MLISSNRTEPIEEPNPLEGVYLSFLKFYISYIDINRNDLLDPENPNSITKEDIDIYFEIDGEKIRAYLPDNNEVPEFFKIVPIKIHEDYFCYILLFPYYIPNENNRAITYIDIAGYGEDKIEYEFEEDGDDWRCAKIWYNNELVWPSNNPHEIFTLRYFIIEK